MTLDNYILITMLIYYVEHHNNWVLRKIAMLQEYQKLSRWHLGLDQQKISQACKSTCTGLSPSTLLYIRMQTSHGQGALRCKLEGGRELGHLVPLVQSVATSHW